MDTFRRKLADKGWAVVATAAKRRDEISNLMLGLIQSLGDILPGRGGSYVEQVVPETFETARVGSLSQIYGLNPLPLHSDTAHWVVPCRYLALACVDPGAVPTATWLLDSRRAVLNRHESAACRSAVFSIRNGRSSFYGVIEQHDRPFIRLDPGCMMPLTKEGEIAMAAYNIDRHENVLDKHEWVAGDILVLDNWRFLHGRGRGGGTDQSRLLLRAMVE